MTSFKFPVEASHILMFARSVGDPNPVYADSEHAATRELDGPIAPPTFVQASAQFDPDYFLRPKSGARWFGSGKLPTGDSERLQSSSGTGLHAEQHYEYHRHPKASDVLTATVTPGKSWEKQGRKGGLLRFRETVTEYRDQHGELVVTARGVGVQTEKVVEQGS